MTAAVAPASAHDSWRVDGVAKATGAERYTADIALPGCLVGKVLRSPHAHARIVRLDTQRAARVPRVEVILTGQDLAGRLVGRILQDMPLLATDRVRYVGEKVAAVAAHSAEAAEEALRLIEVEYEELPAVFDPLEAMQPGAPLVHERVREYAGAPADLPDLPNVQSRLFSDKGDVDQGFAESDHVFEHTFTTPAVHQGYLEPHVCVVHAAGDSVDVWAANKSPFKLRDWIATCSGLPPERVRIHPGAIGGDFGGKGSFMDVPLSYFLSTASGRPVRMVMSYLEDLQAANPRHAAVIHLRTGVKRDGRLWARDFRIVYDGGAYGAFKPSRHVGLNGTFQGTGPYRIPHVRIEGLCVYTNSVPRGHFRAPGEAQALFAVECATDLIARELGCDPYAFRRLNALVEGDTDGRGNRLEDVRVVEVLDAAAGAASWGAPKRGPHIGRGIALFNRHQAEGQCSAKVRLGPSGLDLITALPDVGTGAYTALREVVARTMGVRAPQVRVQVGTTDSVLPEPGVGATRVTILAGEAAQAATQEVRTTFLARLGEVYGWDPDRIQLADGVISGPDGAQLGFAEAVRGVVEEEESAIEVSTRRGVDHSHHPTVATAQVAEVEVDPATGQVRVEAFYTAHDVGTILNPVLHQGQIEGGVVQGLGYALMEDLHLEGGRVQTLNLGEYKLPTQRDIPRLETVLVQGGNGPGPFALKAIGESALSGVAPAIANAIHDAVGARVTALPLTPERVRAAIAATADEDTGA